VRAVLRFFKATVIGGLFFLVPAALIILALEKLAGILRPVADEAAAVFSPFGIGPAWQATIIIAMLVLAAFLAGLFGSTVAGRGLFGWIEAALLSRVPGYGIVKSAAADAAGNTAQLESAQRSSAVFVRIDEGWQIGFVMDRVGEDMFAIFVPDAPSPTSGTVLFASSDQFVDSGLKIADALRCLRQLGAGSTRMFRPPDRS
ncbi:MAG TPA: DUF502 domain-containing protein, partial [Bauldia sp.]|nr:DUF502 domain-containing protein [Bauldia sp.]